MSAIAAPVGPDRSEIGRWGACFAAIAALHAGLLVYLAAQSPPTPKGAIDLPAIVMIDMAPPPAPSPAEAVARPAEPEPAAPEPEPQPVAEAAEPPPVPPPPVEAVVPPPPPTPKSVVTLPAPPKPRPKPPEKVAEKAPPKPVRAAPISRRAAPQTHRAPAEPAAAQRTAALPSSAGSANPAASAASAASWRSQLVAYLQGSLRYPPGSHGGGVASVSFSMNRSGRVLSASLARSAGSPELDAAALELFRRSGLPAPPPDVPGATFTFTIPIRFSAR